MEISLPILKWPPDCKALVPYSKSRRRDLQLDDVWMSEQLQVLDLTLDSRKHVLVYDFVLVDDLYGDRMSCQRMNRTYVLY